MASRKVGVLTFHRCINYGSYWQARCLVEGLRAAGHDAVLLDHVSERVNRAEWRCALSPILPAPTTAPDRRLYRVKVDRFLDAFAGLPLSAPFDLDEPGGMEPCDLVIVGSDEVWNLRHPWYGRHRLFFGDGLRANRLASYAASFGNHDVHDGLDPGWRAALGPSATSRSGTPIPRPWWSGRWAAFRPWSSIPVCSFRPRRGPTRIWPTRSSFMATASLTGSS